MFPVPGTSVLYFSLSVCACNGLLVPMTLLDGLETSKSFLKSIFQVIGFQGTCFHPV